MIFIESVQWYYVPVAIFGILLWQLSKIGRRPKDYPPGPPTLPLLGNLHLIPNENRHLQFEKWAREYGPIFSLMLGTKAMIVLNSDQAIKDLVDKRGAIYSSRPDAYIAQDVLSGGLRVLFMVRIPATCCSSVDGRSRWMTDYLTAKLSNWNVEDGQEVSASEYVNFGVSIEPNTLLTRAPILVLSVSAARTYVPYQDLENKAMLLGVLENPNNFIEHLRRYTASLTTQMTFGFRTTDIGDPRFKQAFDVCYIPLLDFHANGNVDL
jgi:hypothetical protein